MPDTFILEAPEGVQRVSGFVAIHHIPFHIFYKSDIVFFSDVAHHLVVMRDGKGSCPTEALTLYVMGVQRELKSLVGSSSEVYETGRVPGACHGGDRQQQVAGQGFV